MFDEEYVYRTDRLGRINIKYAISSGGRSIQIFYLSTSSNTTVQKYSVTSKTPAFKSYLSKCSNTMVQKYSITSKTPASKCYLSKSTKYSHEHA